MLKLAYLQIRYSFQSKSTDIFLISPRKHVLWYSLEEPLWGTSNEFHNTFSWRTKKNIMWLSPLIWIYEKTRVFPLQVLTLNAPITTAADDNFFLFIFFYFSEKTSLDISCEIICLIFQRKQVLTLHVNCLPIHLKCQDSFSLKNKKNNNKMSSATNFAWRFKG